MDKTILESQQVEEVQDQVQFDEFEKQEIKDIQNSKLFYLPNGKFSIKKFLANVITIVLVNLTTKLKWQVGFFIWLVIAMPIGTYTAVKWIINLF